METNMKIKTIYFSPTGNTKKTVKAVAEGMYGEVSGIDLTMPFKRKKKYNLDSVDLVIVGVPVYGGRIPQLLKSSISHLDLNGKRAVAIVTYGNREYDDALLELSDMLHEDGCDVIAAAAVIGEHSFTSEVGKGRPDREDCRELISFGERICEKMVQVENGKVYEELSIKGNHPYKDLPTSTDEYGPETTEACTRCGICSNLCPTGAISGTNQSLVAADKCIHCFACVKNCPVMAKHFTVPQVDTIRNRLETNCKTNKKMELYI